MDLTPIKIPRKSKGDHSKAAIAARKAMNRPYRNGRPLKPASVKDIEELEIVSLKLAKEPKKRSLRNLKSKHKMSALEKLPTELLQHVFLYCLNLNLPRSSPIIAGKLSSPTMYSRTIIAAFGPTWEAWHGKDRNRRIDKDLSGGDAVLQSAILRCRWASLNVLLRGKDSWLQSCTEPRDFIPLYFRRGGGTMSEAGEYIPTPVPKTAKEYFDIDFAGFCAFTAEIDGPSIWHTCNWERNTDVSDGLEIPIGLLSGPWTDDMVKYLFWLVKSGAEIDWIHSTIGEVGITGLRTAIVDGDIRAIHLLQWAGLIEKLDMDTLVWALQNAGGNKQAVINHLLRIGFGILSDPDARKLGRALSSLRDKAIEEEDQDKLDFFLAVRKSRTLRDITNLHV